jgi:hypothetical protein
MRALSLLVLAACNGTVGTISVSLITAPGSTALDNASTLKLVVTNPHDVTTVQRSASGAFDISLDLPGDGGSGSLIVDALDANGVLVATGSSPPFPFGAIDAGVVIYMAPPLSIGAAPVTLTPARAGLAAGELSYGAIYAGGLDATGAPLGAVAVYNAYDHSLAAGMALPAPRSAMALGVGADGVVYLFGGTDATSNATSNLWRFDTKATPNGAYQDFGEKAGFARTGELALPIGGDEFVLTGTPVAELAGLDGSVSPLTQVASLPAAGATVTASDGVTTTIFAGASGVTRYRNGTFDTLAIPAAARDNATLAALPGGRVLVACGGGDPIAIDAATGEAQTASGTAGRTSGCAVAVTSRHVVIAGGAAQAGVLATTTIVLDATTLVPVASPPLLVPRMAPSALALPNDQVLIAGGADMTGAPTETLELFTPDPTE